MNQLFVAICIIRYICIFVLLLINSANKASNPAQKNKYDLVDFCHKQKSKKIKKRAPSPKGSYIFY